jgi:hypothetical protein
MNVATRKKAGRQAGWKKKQSDEGVSSIISMAIHGAKKTHWGLLLMPLLMLMLFLLTNEHVCVCVCG